MANVNFGGHSKNVVWLDVVSISSYGLALVALCPKKRSNLLIKLHIRS
jgi:hypothetical protein